MADQQPDDYETGRTYSSAEISRRIKRRRMQPTTALSTLTAQFLASIEEFNRERRADILAAAGDRDDDHDPFETVRVIADEWAITADDTDARAALLDRLADSLDTSEVRALRLAAEAAAAITPRLIVADAAANVRPADTAADLGVTESYVYRILREHRAAQSAPTTWDAFYTVERWDGDDWREEAAQSVSTEDGPDMLARRLLDRTQPHYAGAKLRIRVWKFGESDGFPLATAAAGQQ
ncbi:MULTISPECIES: hypothetical protein [Streptomyces rochei group]|uniref:hypothetical protein n=1 Tax=Streptomyces rochei group TaxID=2867164 RepID=UPI001874C16A|nr:hypothetical protein [Streptomyces vinaceusdrappus]GHC44392.1 hypothetical protein GCM10010308_74540 [Streptomyces vinaceusdrappus]